MRPAKSDISERGEAYLEMTSTTTPERVLVCNAVSARRTHSSRVSSACLGGRPLVGNRRRISPASANLLLAGVGQGPDGVVPGSIHAGNRVRATAFCRLHRVWDSV